MPARLGFAVALVLAGLSPVPGLAAPSAVVEPIEVRYRAGWMRDVNARRPLSDRITAPEADRLARDLGAELEEALLAELQARGLTGRPGGADGWRIAARIADLDVHAPGQAPPGARTYFREAGSATLVFEAREVATGRVVASQRDTGATPRVDDGFHEASPVSNRARFAALFRQAARSFVATLPPR